VYWQSDTQTLASDGAVVENTLETLWKRKNSNFVWKPFRKTTRKWDNDSEVEITDRGFVDGRKKHVEFGHD
jgi:hypothetical protein